MFFPCLPMLWLLRHQLCHKLEWSTRPASGGSEERHCNLQTQRSKVLHTECTVIQLLHRQRPAETATTKETKHFTKCFSAKPTVFWKHHLFTQIFIKWRLRPTRWLNGWSTQNLQSGCLEGNIGTQLTTMCYRIGEIQGVVTKEHRRGVQLGGQERLPKRKLRPEGQKSQFGGLNSVKDVPGREVHTKT